MNGRLPIVTSNAAKRRDFIWRALDLVRQSFRIKMKRSELLPASEYEMQPCRARKSGSSRQPIASAFIVGLVVISLTTGCRPSCCCLDNRPPQANWETVMDEEPWHYGYRPTNWSSWNHDKELETPPLDPPGIEEVESGRNNLSLPSPAPDEAPTSEPETKSL